MTSAVCFDFKMEGLGSLLLILLLQKVLDDRVHSSPFNPIECIKHPTISLAGKGAAMINAELTEISTSILRIRGSRSSTLRSEKKPCHEERRGEETLLSDELHGRVHQVMFLNKLVDLLIRRARNLIFICSTLS